MKVLKGLALGLLGFLLFLSLVVFGPALTLNLTVLNPGFVTTEINRISISSIAEDVVRQETTTDDIPEEVKIAFVDALKKAEPVVKENLNKAVLSVYDYLLGKKPNPELALTLRNTLLNPNFIVSLVDQVDMTVLAREYIRRLPPGELPVEAKHVVPYVDVAITELKPWIDEQVRLATEPTVDYLLGKSSGLRVSIPLEQVKQTIKGTVKAAFLKSPPAEFAALPQATLSQYYDNNVGAFADSMPATFVLDETLVGSELPAEITGALADAESGLIQARQDISLFQLYFWLLLIFILLLILGIALIHRQVKGASRTIGIIFLACGVPVLLGVLIGTPLARAALAVPDIPAQIQSLLPRMMSDAFAPLQFYSIGLIAVGVALLVVSFVYKPSSAE